MNGPMTAIIPKSNLAPAEPAQNNITIIKPSGKEPVLYPSRLSFGQLIDALKKRAASAHRPGRAFLLRQIIQQVEQKPELLAPIDDPRVLSHHHEEVDLLMSTLFPDGQEDYTLGRAFKPLDLFTFYQTQSLKRLLQGESGMEYCLDNQSIPAYNFIVYAACCLILNKFYGQSIKVETPLTVSLVSAGQPLERYYKCLHNLSYIDVKATRPLPELSEQDIHKLLGDPMNWEQWLQYLPPSHFEFQGLVTEHLTEITEEASLSRIKFLLLEKDVVADPLRLAKLENFVRIGFRQPHLRLGLAATSDKGCLHASLKYQVGHHFLADAGPGLLQTEGNIYQEALCRREPLLVEDLTQLEEATEVEAALLNAGIRSIIIHPLQNKQGKVIGFMELGTPHTHELNQLILLKTNELGPMIALAIERRREELDNQVEAIIREQYTTLHPSVEWRFVENAFELLEERARGGKEAKVARPITFKNVFPLFAQADIVESTNIRNAAIQEDLLENMAIAREVLEKCRQRLFFPVLEQYIYKIDEYSETLLNSFSSNEESRIMEFLRQEIYPLFQQISQRDAQAAQCVKIYLSQLDPQLGILYRKRKAYEESVALINETVARYLEEEDERAQAIVPHYFEKYKTDGVEFEIYAGQSLLKKEAFSDLHLKNLRLWQLLAMCNVTRQVAALKARLPIPLDTAQTVFVYSTPLDIRFRMDEKRFDVDGAYNIRYEIIKKRIDKAVVDGTEERLRAPGKLTIVYANEKDRQEYMEYLKFMAARQLIHPQIEELSVGELQGVEGLKALRVTPVTKKIDGE